MNNCQGCNAPVGGWVSFHKKEHEWKPCKEDYSGDSLWGPAVLINLAPRTIEGLGEKQVCQQCAQTIDKKEQAHRSRIHRANSKRFKAEKAGQLELF